ncbi:MAG TPA: chromate efflux transporter [Stenotrophomonas sp.]|nr:chromate efflux transporter [Stenotrophomonas sp.]
MPTTTGSAREVFTVFLRLGLTSFGGPIAHIGYFQREFVQRRAWLDASGFAQLLAICQALPGPASSQLGFALGLRRAGWLGGVAAFCGFTLPSALLMFAAALHLPALLRAPLGMAVLHGLKLVAVVMVAQGVWSMARALTPDLPRKGLALLAAAIVLLGAAPGWQLVAIGVGALAGLWLPATARVGIAPLPGTRLPSRRVAMACLALLATGFALSLFGGRSASLAGVAAADFRAGALVFGGGHVVLPLLQGSFVGNGWVSAERFLAGYGAAQAVPGPMFSFAAFLGASVEGVPPLAGALLGLLALFLPGFLLLVAALPYWSAWLADRRRAGIVAGINAAVVGLLAAALYDPLWLQAIDRWQDLAVVAVGLLLVMRWRLHALWTVAWCVPAAMLLGTIGAGLMG